MAVFADESFVFIEDFCVVSTVGAFERLFLTACFADNFEARVQREFHASTKDTALVVLLLHTIVKTPGSFKKFTQITRVSTFFIF